MPGQVKYWAVIPAAGIGMRMGSEIPKQYLQIHGKTILEHALESFCRHRKIAGVVVALAEKDPHWKKTSIASHDKVMTTMGGTERCHSVLNGLKFLQQWATADDWVMVHDAARPCLRHTDIDQLITELSEHPVGGLLALPVRDTLKCANQGKEVMGTVNRDGLWHALTPQMFRLNTLEQAIEQALRKEQIVTDEAQAIELYGMQPKLVQGRPDNIKITHREDLVLAELFLMQEEPGR